jgi:hypothetical protein
MPLANRDDHKRCNRTFEAPANGLLDKDGMFQLLQTVNKYAIQNPLTEGVLKKVFEKFWPDLHAELQQMKVPEQPEKSSRGAQEMLEEILSLVRSIDKATNLSSEFGLPLANVLSTEPGRKRLPAE